MNLEDIMETQVCSVSPAATLVEAAQLMRSEGVGFLPVLDGEELMGTVTDRDLVIRGVAESRNALSTTVREVMSVEVVCCFVDQSVDEARELMAAYGVRRLPVIDQEHHLVGVVSHAALEGIGLPKTKAHKVTFHKEKTDSYGHPHKVPIKTVYITTAKDRREVEATAIERLQQEEHTAWTNVAQSYEIEEDPAAGEKKTD